MRTRVDRHHQEGLRRLHGHFADLCHVQEHAADLPRHDDVRSSDCFFVTRLRSRIDSRSSTMAGTRIVIEAALERLHPIDKKFAEGTTFALRCAQYVMFPVFFFRRVLLLCKECVVSFEFA